MKKTHLLLLLFLMNIVAVHAKIEGFELFKDGQVAQIHLQTDSPMPLKIAAQHLQDDIEAVTGVRPEIIDDKQQLRGNVIFLSLNNGDEKSLNDLYESYLMRPVKSKDINIQSAIEVIGSDATGAAYGVYNISKMIGVSPFYWYCDLTPERRSEVILMNCDIAPRQPSVRYRGIFINDEEAKIQWSKKTSKDKSNGFISPENYKRIFELMLRVGANTLWPSMMEEGAYFFEAKDENGVAINPRNATDYGVYVGTSHCENMARNNNAEWYEWAERNRSLFEDDMLEFDYTVNPRAIEQYWRERLEESRNFNIIYTMGIRAVHDSEFKHRKLENPTLENKVKVIQMVIDRQREIIAEVYGSPDAVPQIFTPYEEMAEFYNGETKNGDEKCQGLIIPDDVIIISTDDNYGFLRQIPTPREVERKGGSGIYYHIAYQGNPAPYDWITTTPYKQMQSELRKLYNIGATKFWIVNVGDIKPSEMTLQYFMELASNSEMEFARNPREYLSESARSLFGFDEERAKQFSDLYTDFCLAANIQKPEFMSSCLSVNYDRPIWAKFSYYSLSDFGDEAQRAIDKFVAMEKEAKQMYSSASANYKDAFYHMVYYPIRSTRLMAEKSYYYYKNLIYYRQGRFASVNAYKNLSQKASEAIDKDLHYFNKVLSGGKWDGIMDPYAYYNIYERVVDDANIPHKFVYNERFREQSAKNNIGAVCEGQILGTEDVRLLFSSFEDNRRFIDIFTTGLGFQNWSIKSDKPWVKFTQSSGKTNSEQRIWISLDWEALDAGEQYANVSVSGKNGVIKSFPIVAHKFTGELQDRSYIEGAGFVVIEAEHYTKSIKGKGGVIWEEIEDLGYCGSSMAIGGSTKLSATDGAALEYKVYFCSTGTFEGTMYRIPSLNEGKDKSCEIAISVNDGDYQILEGIRRKDQTLQRKLPSGKKIPNSNWRMNAFTQIEKIPFEITIYEPGYHTIRVSQVDSGIAFDRIVIATNKQSAVAQSRSMIGALESYNNIREDYTPMTKQATAKITPKLATVNPYPELEPMLYAKFLFANYSTNPPIWGFTPVYTRSEYDKNTVLYGWSKDNIQNITSRQSVGYRPVPFFRLMSHSSKAPATFFATMHEGTYEVTFHSGHVTEYYSGAEGRELNMNIKANGKELVQNLNVKSDQMSVESYEVKVGKDNILQIDFSGDWSISTIEIYRK